MKCRHANISIFVPHIGCPNRCSFCDQRSITGSHRAPSSQDVIDAVRKAVLSGSCDPENTEIAFFGGSFTAINRNYMIRLLKTAAVFAEQGVVKGIRISTRPDAIDSEILKLLKEYRVTAIELGAQSLDDTVLKMNNRGHTAENVTEASKLIKEYGFELGLQMMTGLYGDSDEITLATAKKVISLAPDTVRIYPTIVLKNTYLAALYADKKYCPQELSEAVELCSKLLLLFENAKIDVIRLGLHSIEPEAYVSGPWHPAFRELCESERYYSMAVKKLISPGSYNILVSPGEISKMIGQNKSNIKRFLEMGFECSVKESKELKKHEIKVEGRLQ